MPQLYEIALTLSATEKALLDRMFALAIKEILVTDAKLAHDEAVTLQKKFDANTKALPTVWTGKGAG